MATLGACLLAWVQTFEAATGPVRELAELSDGTALWAVLRAVAPPTDADSAASAALPASPFGGELPEPAAGADWTRRWQNLRHLERRLAVFYRDVGHGRRLVAPARAPDLQAIAAEAALPDLEVLVMMVLRAAMASPESNSVMVQKLMGLGKERATVIATELQEMEDAEDAEREEEEVREPGRDGEAERAGEVFEERQGHGAGADGGLYEDPLLEREQELLRAQDTIAKLQQSQAAALRQVQDLREEKVRLQEAFDAYRGEIDVKGRRPGADDPFKKLQHQAENDRAYIEDLESQMQASRSTLDDYERQLQRYKVGHDGSQKLRDELQLLRSDNEDLQQKIKANENLKKKIQSLQGQDRASANFREQLKEAHERLEDYERLRQLQTSLEKEILEKKGLIRNQEYQINELATMRKHAEFDARALAQKLQEARERQERDHDAIQELQSRLHDANLDDAVPVEPLEDQTTPAEKPVPVPNDELKHMADKLAILEQQLEAADARLKQAAERSAALEEAGRADAIASAARQRSDQQVLEHERTISELRAELQTARSPPLAPPQPPPRSDGTPLAPHDAAALQRENHLMASAWYELAARLQNTGVPLGRRRPEPKSWIGRQRALVGPGAEAVSR